MYYLTQKIKTKQKNGNNTTSRWKTITGRKKNKEKGFRSFTTESGGGTTSGRHCSADENFSKEKGGRQFMWKVGVFLCEKVALWGDEASLETG